MHKQSELMTPRIPPNSEIWCLVLCHSDTAFRTTHIHDTVVKKMPAPDVTLVLLAATLTAVDKINNTDDAKIKQDNMTVMADSILIFILPIKNSPL